MPFNREDLAAAVRNNDAVIDAGGSIPFVLLALEVDPSSAVYVAEQRALRVAMLHSGIPAAEIKAMAERGERFVVPNLHKRQRDLMPVYASIWLDGLAAGVRAYHDALMS